jgi:hypothetical protein
MPIVYQASSLQMEWCLTCHRSPEKFIRPKDKIFDMQWRENSTSEQLSTARDLMANHYRTPKVEVLTNCSTCHR